MTDSPTPPEPGPVDADVELASAHLDGEAGADERARVDDPAVQAHLGALGSVSDQVRDVPPPPPGLLDTHVARAMEAFEGDDRVVPLGRRRAGARPWWERIPLGAVAAALVVVVLVGAVTLTSTAGDDDTDTATSALDSAGESSGGASGMGEDTSAAGAMEESAALESDEHFEAVGTPLYDGYDALADDLRAELAPGSGQADAPAADDDLSTTTSQRAGGDEHGTGEPCDAVGVLGIDPASVLLVRSVVVSGDEVTAVVHDASDGRRLSVVDDATCSVVLDQIL